jgi:hypothetical protein
MNKQKQQIFSILILVVSGLLLIAFAVFFVAKNNTAKNNLTQATPLPTVISGRHGEDTYSEIERVSLADAKAALEAGSAVFVDVRIQEAYTVDHIPGALNIPLAEIETRLGELDPNQWIITYCT